MAVGDRVIIGDGSTWDDSVTIVGYDPRWQQDGDLYTDQLGVAQVVILGGVRGGSLGTIAGASIRVHRIQLSGEKYTASLGGMDLVHVFPVQLDYYQKVAWIPAHHLRVTGGGAGMDIKG